MWWIPTLVQGGMQVASSIWGKPKTDTQSELRKTLGTLAGQGVYSPEDIRKTTGAVSEEYATGEQQQTALIRGYLEKAGLGGSIAGARTLSQVQEPRKRAVAGARTSMELRNVETKREATLDYANLVDTLNRQRRLESAEFKRDLFKGATQAVGAFSEAYRFEKEQEMSGRGIAAREQESEARAGYYKSRTKPEAPFALPENFINFSTEQLAEWARNAGINYEEARRIQDDMFADQLR